MHSDDFEQIVSQHYEALYRFAFSLIRTESDASDLTQQTFYIWATKGHQLRDRTKIRSWLFTTLRREFLNYRRRNVRFSQFELTEEEEELSSEAPENLISLDAARAVEFLARIKQPYRETLTLYYLEEYSYREIAAILEIPIGTVQSRLSRGMSLLQQLMVNRTDEPKPIAPRVTTFSLKTVSRFIGHTSLAMANLKTN